MTIAPMIIKVLWEKSTFRRIYKIKTLIKFSAQDLNIKIVNKNKKLKTKTKEETHKLFWPKKIYFKASKLKEKLNKELL
jgi:hypothetical protein